MDWLLVVGWFVSVTRTLYFFFFLISKWWRWWVLMNVSSVLLWFVVVERNFFCFLTCHGWCHRRTGGTHGSNWVLIVCVKVTCDILFKLSEKRSIFFICFRCLNGHVARCLQSGYMDLEHAWFTHHHVHLHLHRPRSRMECHPVHRTIASIRVAPPFQRRDSHWDRDQCRSVPEWTVSEEVVQIAFGSLELSCCCCCWCCGFHCSDWCFSFPQVCSIWWALRVHAGFDLLCCCCCVFHTESLVICIEGTSVTQIARPVGRGSNNILFLKTRIHVQEPCVYNNTTKSCKYLLWNELAGGDFIAMMGNHSFICCFEIWYSTGGMCAQIKLYAILLFTFSWISQSPRTHCPPGRLFGPTLANCSRHSLHSWSWVDLSCRPETSTWIVLAPWCLVSRSVAAPGSLLAGIGHRRQDQRRPGKWPIVWRALEFCNRTLCDTWSVWQINYVRMVTMMLE